MNTFSSDDGGVDAESLDQRYVHSFERSTATETVFSDLRLPGVGLVVIAGHTGSLNSDANANFAIEA